MKGFYLRFPGGKPKAVTLSYDDGVREDIRLSDTITKYGLKCTFNHNSYRDDLSKEEVEKYVLDRGHELALHGARHISTGLLRPDFGIKEILDCRVALEEKYGIIVRGFAYPDTGIRRYENNTDYQTIKNYLTELNIAYARTLGEDNNGFYIPNDFHAWMPTAYHINPKLFDYIDEFNALNPDSEWYYPNRSPRLFYLWGHSYEFETDNNWERLDEIGKRLGGREDVWYATNMEIYNYVNAYYSLVCSADGTIIHNPTIYKIWLDIEGKPYTVEPGQTIKAEMNTNIE